MEECRLSGAKLKRKMESQNGRWRPGGADRVSHTQAEGLLKPYAAYRR